MITLNLKINNEYKNIRIQEDIIFNAILAEHTDFIKKVIKTLAPKFKINNKFFQIINEYAEFTEDGIAVYTGLIVRTDYDKYVVLHLENSVINKERMMEIIKDFIYDIDDIPVKDVIITEMSIDYKTLLIATRKKES